MGDFKDEHGHSKTTAFLKKIGKSDLIQKALNIAGGYASGGFLGALNGLVKKDKGISEEQQEAWDNAYEIDQRDRADARAMQTAIAISKESTPLAKNFIYFLSIGVFLFAAGMVILLFFREIPDKNRDVVNFILGVVIGTGLTGLFNYFYGSSKGSSDKFKHIINGKK